MPSSLPVACIVTGFFLGAAAGSEAMGSEAPAESPARVETFLLKKVP